jgi:uncharacterized membrane protein
MRHTWLAAMVVCGFSTGAALAQGVPRPSVVPDQSREAETAPWPHASLEHSALKATTFKAGSTAVNFAIFTYATGGVVGGATVALAALGASWTLYTANDYLWDRFSPPPPRSADAAFDTPADVWRNTKKFMTYKPVIAAFKYATVYVYTGSAATTAVAGTAAILVNAVVFYANNIGWDYYEWWYTRPAPPLRPSPGPEAGR